MQRGDDARLVEHSGEIEEGGGAAANRRLEESSLLKETGEEKGSARTEATLDRCSNRDLFIGVRRSKMSLEGKGRREVRR